MLRFGLAKAASVWLVVLFGIVFAAPNLFYDRVERANDARAAAARGLPHDAAAAAAWPGWLPSGLVNLGLDLRGGVHLLVEVEVAGVYGEILSGIWPEVRDALRAVPGVTSVRRQEGAADELRVRIEPASAMAGALAALRGLPGYALEIADAGEGVLSVRLAEAERRALDDRTVAQSLEKIRRRVDEAGTREPSIVRQGADRIVIEVPGLGSAEELLALIGKTARLTFHPVLRSGIEGEPVSADELLLRDEAGRWLVVERAPVVTGDELVDAHLGYDQNGLPAVAFRFNAYGARKFGDYTRDNIGKLFAIVLDDLIISAPEIITHIPGGSGQITGRFTTEEATRLAVLLRAGALPAAIKVLEQRTVGPELGQDSIDAGRIASVIALAAVMVYMVASYGLFGLFANIALAANIALIFAILSVLGATLTLPGIAGIVLTIGMAVDANVLIFERIREELTRAKSVMQAVEQGFRSALSAIADANITTLIAVVILFWVGSGPVRGFAITLGIGVLTSVFTAYFVTRSLMAGWILRTRPKAITI